MIWQKVHELGTMILVAISSRAESATSTKRAACGGDGIKLLQLLHAECDNLNTGSQNLIKDKINKISSAGFDSATCAAFANYRESIGALNCTLGSNKRMDEDALTANYESAVNRAGPQKDFDMKVMQ